MSFAAEGLPAGGPPAEGPHSKEIFERYSTFFKRKPGLFAAEGPPAEGLPSEWPPAEKMSNKT